jgi:aminoglycoside phosphotransferase (APT) family kinase protein
VIPVEVAEVTPEWMSGALGRGVSAVTVLDQHSGTTGRARVRVDYAEVSDGGPDTVFVKLAPFDPQQRAFVEEVGLGIAEARFYREIAAELPVRVPLVYHSDWDDDGRYVMVLEDVTASGCRFPRPRDEDIAVTAGRIVEELAKLHAHFWADPRLDGELAWVTEGKRVGFGGPSRYIGLAVERFGDEMGPTFRRIAELYAEKPREVAAVLGSGTPTLVHGDAHLGNLLVDDADGGRPGFFDWAMVWRAGGMRDVAYVLGNSIPTEVRREGEREWLQRYVDGLAAGGVTLDVDDAWEQYRVLVTYSWASATSTAAMGSLWQSEKIGQGGMRRATATIEDLDTVSALEARLP